MYLHQNAVVCYITQILLYGGAIRRAEGWTLLLLGSVGRKGEAEPDVMRIPRALGCQLYSNLRFHPF
jgi:hypothetical protein